MMVLQVLVGVAGRGSGALKSWVAVVHSCWFWGWGQSWVVAGLEIRRISCVLLCCVFVGSVFDTWTTGDDTRAGRHVAFDADGCCCWEICDVADGVEGYLSDLLRSVCVEAASCTFCCT